ncbi:MAG: IclR family transcriptional regulator [Dehalococcoidales bacterium]|nr:IclR family transcriptional regulator [Dehalococcoidales bacterium]
MIKSVVKVANILNAISNNNNKLRDISRETKISKPTLHRLLQTLKQIGLIQQDLIRKEYYLGSLLFKFTSDSLSVHQHLIYSSYSRMDDLRHITGETISLDIKVGMEKIKLQQLLGTHNVLFVGVPPYYEYLWSGSMGKALLSQIPDDELETILDHTELKPLTSRTITDKKKFRQEIEKVRVRGYATGLGETDLSIAGISAPINNYYVPASLTIIGPFERMTTHLIDFSDELVKKAKEISKDIISDKNNKGVKR